jgi:catechol 2,3-dioxygenase-like lactoylglutathione lyase family enzyme
LSRVQLALNVSDLDAAVEFYSTMFATAPAKRRPGYANFAIADPPLKLVLIEAGDDRGSGVAGALNHLGIEVESTDEVTAAAARLSRDGLAVSEESSTACCYSLQDKVWAHDPDGAPWETYVVLADAPNASKVSTDAQCCLPTAPSDEVSELHLVPVAAAPASGCC